jgi:hypothetical protein
MSDAELFLENGALGSFAAPVGPEKQDVHSFSPYSLVFTAEDAEVNPSG